jgi:hypothetical protein
MVQLQGFKLDMSIPWWAPEIFRELRFWFAPPSVCPWGLIGLCFVVGLLISCITGFVIGALVFSSHCRRITIQLLSVTLACLQPSIPVARTDLGARLAEHRRRQ